MTSTSDRPSGDRPDTGRVAFLQSVPLFGPLAASELRDLAAAMQPVELEPGALLWRQGEPADALHVIVRGAIAIHLRRPGGTEVQLATLGAGEVLGEVPLIDGGVRSATARIVAPTRVLALSRADFAALTLRRNPTAFAVRRQVCALACARLRERYAELAGSLGEARAGPRDPTPLPEAGEPDSTAPPVEYLTSLPFFRDFTGDQALALIERSQLVFVPRDELVTREGDAAGGLHVTLRGAVELAIVRGQRRVPIGLAGPGHAFSYIRLIDGGAQPLTTRTRERTLLLRVPPDVFDAYFDGDTAASYALFNGIERDLMATLRRKDRGFVRAVGSAAARGSRGQSGSRPAVGSPPRSEPPTTVPSMP